VTLLVLSPHLDDAVLAAAGSLAAAAELGTHVVVLTVFAGAPPPGALGALARDLHDDCGLGRDAVAVRRAEDSAAAEVLGFRTRWLDLPDAVYRRPGGTPLYATRDELFGEPDPLDDDLVERAVRAVVEAVPGPAGLLVPLAVGGHVDHRLTRSIGETVAGLVRPGVVAWYEESVYEAQFADRAWADVGCDGLRRSACRLPVDRWAAKVRAVACYASQLRMLSPGPASSPRRADFHARLRHEGLWHRNGRFGDGRRRADRGGGPAR
jgi:LmbE family N-acetylglucosaminyl deacetylase